MKKVEIELFRYHNILFGQVLHMDESLRGVKDIIDDGQFSIHSFHRPQLICDSLFLRGDDQDADDKVFSYDYESEAEAIETAHVIKTLIDKLNEDTVTSESLVERIV